MHRKPFFIPVTALAVLLLLSSPSLSWGEEKPATPAKVRTDIHLSGVYPHLTVYGIYSQNGAHRKTGHNECGIGAIVPWAGKLWMVNYAPHMPRGSEHKLFSVDADLSRPLTVHPESVGGTPAGRMIHAESNQLLIGHHLIDAKGKVRTISPQDMPIRVTAIARHLKDPKNKVYYVDMEGSIWEANVHTLEVTRLFKKPVPGWHGKGGYTSQGLLVVSNNGELHVGDYKDLLTGGPAKTPEDRGVLAQYDGEQWRVIERRQFTEVTGPQGITGGSDGDDPIWSIGWDRRSLRLKLLEDGQWHTYLLPKASYCNDASHGWYTEWPRIREITGGRWLMDMHGMFFDFPPTFSTRNSAGIKPVGSHLRYVPDFCAWNGKLVLASDETSIQGNELAGQPQTNLWFGQYEDLKQWGPASAYGGPWIEDDVKADTPSDPFLISGFDRRILHLATGRKKPAPIQATRATDQQKIIAISGQLAKYPRVTVRRGDWRKAAPGYEFTIDQPATIYLAVDRRGSPRMPAGWEKTRLSVRWGKNHVDDVYRRDFAAGAVAIPPNETEHTPGSFGMPHTAFVAAKSTQKLSIKPGASVSVTPPEKHQAASGDDAPVTFALQIDRRGNGKWEELKQLTLPGRSYQAYHLPADLDAVWLRIVASRDCIATAVLHQTTASFRDGGDKANQQLFAGLADVTDDDTLSARVYPAKRNRNLRLITGSDGYWEFTKTGFEFKQDEPDEALHKLLEVEPEFRVDAASVIVTHQGRQLRLPKGHAAYDQPFASGWPRAVREVESERHLANIHGTFYELPLITNGAPPAWNRIRPVASHQKRITDFCSWNGLLILTGLKAGATTGGHIFAAAAPTHGMQPAIWAGGVDDLWKLGKPTGHGGPWLNTAVQPHEASDPYLMTGYDRKQITLSHTADKTVNIKVQVDIEGTGVWVDYQTFRVAAGKPLTHAFDPGYSACWLRVISDTATTATAQLKYE